MVLLSNVSFQNKIKQNFIVMWKARVSINKIKVFRVDVVVYRTRTGVIVDSKRKKIIIKKADFFSLLRVVKD